MTSQPTSGIISLVNRKHSVQARARTHPTSVIYPATQEETKLVQSRFSARQPSDRLKEPVAGIDTIHGDSRATMRAHTTISQSEIPAQVVQNRHASRESVTQAKRPADITMQRPFTKHAPSVWSPSASLLPTLNTAPLACRMSIAPLASHAPVTQNISSVVSHNLLEQEQVMINDLLFVLMGFEGQYVCYDEKYNPLEEKDRLQGPDFRVSSEFDPSLRDLAHGVLAIASSYSAMEAFLDVMGKDECGAVSHALCAAIRKFLKQYLILITQAEDQHVRCRDLTLHQLNLLLKPTGHLLTQLQQLTQQLLKGNGFLEETDQEDEVSEDLEAVFDNLSHGRDTSASSRQTCKGGAILRSITQHLRKIAGDTAASELIGSLLEDSSRPYMRMLNEWLQYGNVIDYYGEFLIKEQKSIRREGLQKDFTDEYWEKRYTIRLDQVPTQLETIKDKVLLAGKYLNVVRECGGIFSRNEEFISTTDLPQTFADPRVTEYVSRAYTFANRSLMELLVTTHGLPARFQSLKHYFFLDQGDFFSHFLELSSSELRKSSKNVNANKLQSLLDIVIRQPGSVAVLEPFKEDVKVTMSDTGLTGWLMRVVNVQGMDADTSSLSAAYTPAARSIAGKDEKDITGYEALTLDYSVPFPLSLIISRNTLTRYQLLFRYLLSLRHLEIQLTQSWTEHTKGQIWRNQVNITIASPEYKSLAMRIENWKRRAWTLRSRMLCFVQQLLYFCTSEVIEPNWTAFMQRLQSRDMASPRTASAAAMTDGPKQAHVSIPPPANGTSDAASTKPKSRRTVDELMQDHVDLLATCLKECMLTNSKLLRINSKVMSTCGLFANYTSSLTRSLASIDLDATDANTFTGNKSAYDPAKLDKLFNILNQYEDHFSRHLKILLDALNYLAATETVVFLGLCARLSMANEGARGESGVNGRQSSASAYV